MYFAGLQVPSHELRVTCIPHECAVHGHAQPCVVLVWLAAMLHGDALGRSIRQERTAPHCCRQTQGVSFDAMVTHHYSCLSTLPATCKNEIKEKLMGDPGFPVTKANNFDMLWMCKREGVAEEGKGDGGGGGCGGGGLSGRGGGRELYQ